MPIDSLKARMFRIKQASGLDLSTAGSTSPRRSFHSPALCVFHEISRVAGPFQQVTKYDGLRHELVEGFDGHFHIAQHLVDRVAGSSRLTWR